MAALSNNAPPPLSPASIAVLVPAAGRVPEGLLALSNIGCPAMIPVAGRPVIYWTVRYLLSLGMRHFAVAVARRGMFIEDFVDCSFGQVADVSFIVPAADGGVGRTVLDLAEAASGEAALVVLGDTHFQFRDFAALRLDAAAVLVHEVEESYRWCTVDLAADGSVSDFYDKVPDRPGKPLALVGVYYFPDREELVRCARRALHRAAAENRRLEMSDILREVQKQRPIYAQTVGDWLDCGNADRQASSHRALLQKRAFNELAIDGTFGTVTKRSRHIDKFLDEINYFRLLPPQLAVLFPRVVNYSADYTDPWLTLEYYGYPSLSEVFVYENVDAGVWEQVFSHLHQIVKLGFQQVPHPLKPGTLRSMYLEKTRQRLDQLTGPAELVALVRQESPLIVNGQSLTNLPGLWTALEDEVARLEANAAGSAVHGDLCFSNILYDLRSRICKLIDPRGSFGAAGIFGDPRYDVAKLYHSAYGLYDFIVNDLFHIEVRGGRVELSLRQRPLHDEIRRRFERVFFAEFDRREILFITGLLFASMPALHYDSPQRQLAMYARAVQLLNEALALPRPGQPAPPALQPATPS